MIVLAVIGINLALLTTGVFVWFYGQGLEKENRGLRTRYAEYESKHATLLTKAGDYPDKKTLELMQKDIKTINLVLHAHRYDTNLALGLLEKHIPKEVYLTQYNHDSESGVILLSAASANKKELTVFLRQLEQDSTFTNVSLLRQNSNTQKNVLLHLLDIKLEQVR